MATFKDVISEDKPVLVDFTAAWCGPCQTMNPIIKQLATEIGDKARILKVDIDKNPGAATAFNVSGVPTFIIFRSGKILWRRSGMMPLSELKNTLLEFCRTH